MDEYNLSTRGVWVCRGLLLHEYELADYELGELWVLLKNKLRIYWV